MTDAVRVRFAPSPTGPMHIGGLRTAIFNWLFARHYGGTFILRIEDTDRGRYKAGSEELIYSALDWVGVDVDEGPRKGGESGPYRQSERLDMYTEWAKWLVDNNKAYYDYTTPEELAALREEQKAQNISQGYDRRHRDISKSERAKLKAEGRPEVIRLKMPLDGTTIIHDMLRGDIEVENTQLNDLVLLKSDGFPTYHLANVVDDHFMKISHIMRANEWIGTAPIHKQLYLAFGWEMPQVMHLPLMLNPNGKGKMSKRNPPKDEKGNIIPVLVDDYKKNGYLPEAMMNFLSNVGWTFGDDQEIFTVNEAIKRFDGTRINAANGAYPYDKLVWMNGIYIREKLTAEELALRLKQPLIDVGLEPDEDKLRIITPAIQARLETLNDVVELTRFIFTKDFVPAPAEDLIQKKMDVESTIQVLELAHEFMSNIDFSDPVAMEAHMREFASSTEFKVGQIFGTLRAATSAQKVSPPLFDSFAALGKDETLKRVQLATSILKS